MLSAAYEFVWSPDLEQSVKEDDADELVLGVSFTDDEWQRDGGRQFIAAVGLGQTRLSGGGRNKQRGGYDISQAKINDEVRCKILKGRRG